MTVDERIEALTARHEAIAQSVELLGSFQRDTDAKIDKLIDQVGKLTGHMDSIAGHMNTIALLVLGHEQRIQSIEKQ